MINIFLKIQMHAYTNVNASLIIAPMVASTRNVNFHAGPSYSYIPGYYKVAIAAGCSGLEHNVSS